MDLKNRSHKLKRGEKIDKLARKFGHANSDAIWKHAKNKRLRNKRKTKDALEARDVLYIPLNKKEAKQVAVAVAALSSIQIIEVELQGALLETHANYTVTAASIEGNRVAILANLKSVEATMFGAIAQIRNAKMQVDLKKEPHKAAKIIAQRMKKIEQSIANAEKASEAAKQIANTGVLPRPKQVKKEGASVESVFKELYNFVKVAGADNSMDSVGSVASALAKTIQKGQSEIARQISGKVSPRYWFDLLVMSEVDEIDFDKEKDKTIKKMLKSINYFRAAMVIIDKVLDFNKRGYETAAKSVLKELKSCQSRIGELEKQVKAFPAPKDIPKL